MNAPALLSDFADIPTSRAAAKAAGSPHYFTGVPCRNGHVDKRTTRDCICLGCSRDSSKRYRAANPDKVHALFQSWYEENKSSVIERNSAKRKADVEAARRQDRINYANTAEARKEYSRKYRAANPEKRLVLQNARRARELGAEGSYTVEDARRIRAAQNDTCVYCPTDLKGKGHLDHIKPLSKGGSNWPNNLQWLCVPCNISKHDRDAIDFARSKGKLL